MALDDTTGATRAAMTARVYRMDTEEHTCPFGLKSLDLLKKHGYEVEDHRLSSREETDRFKQEHGVETTPQTFIGDRRIGGHEDLRAFFGDEPLGEDETTYRPVLALFAMAAAMAVAVSIYTFGGLTFRTVEWFASIAMCLLALQKLQDVESFSTMFLNYDLLAKRWVRYGYFYPYGEGLAGVLMIAGIMPLVSGPIAVFIGLIGAVSVIKAVYVDKRELKCACVGGGSNVPLGFLSLTENLVMLAMGIWVLVKYFGGIVT